MDQKASKYGLSSCHNLSPFMAHSPHLEPSGSPSIRDIQLDIGRSPPPTSLASLSPTHSSTNHLNQAGHNGHPPGHQDTNHGPPGGNGSGVTSNANGATATTTALVCVPQSKMMKVTNKTVIIVLSVLFAFTLLGCLILLVNRNKHRTSNQLQQQAANGEANDFYDSSKSHLPRLAGAGIGIGSGGANGSNLAARVMQLEAELARSRKEIIFHATLLSSLEDRIHLLSKDRIPHP